MYHQTYSLFYLIIYKLSLCNEYQKSTIAFKSKHAINLVTKKEDGCQSMIYTYVFIVEFNIST